ncbi:hypothetical protein RRG08_046562 [Elysia crispata]|uniref:Uncharacterized protein n=1 Tax=Elysia crispata TaxID=231223 RepID=A0AAE1APB5_9GAST|nr:hypothetical protein RRG08_046562 [Elysia crispata]
MSTQNDTDVIESHPTKQPSDDDKPGELGTARLYTSQDAKPKVLPCKKIPFALTQRVKDELETSSKSPTARYAFALTRGHSMRLFRENISSFPLLMMYYLRFIRQRFSLSRL